MHLKDLLNVLRRHWRIVFIVSLLVSSGAWFSSRNTVPQYQSALTVQISSPKQAFARLDDIDVDELALKTDPILSEALVLTTQGLALRVVDRLGLQLEMVDPTLSRGAFLAGLVLDSAAVAGKYELEFNGPAGWTLRHAVGPVLAQGSFADTVEGPGFTLRAVPSEATGMRVGFRISSAPVAASWTARSTTAPSAR